MLRDAITDAARVAILAVARPDGTPLVLDWGAQLDLRHSAPAEAGHVEDADGRINDSGSRGMSRSTPPRVPARPKPPTVLDKLTSGKRVKVGVNRHVATVGAGRSSGRAGGRVDAYERHGADAEPPGRGLTPVSGSGAVSRGARESTRAVEREGGGDRRAASASGTKLVIEYYLSWRSVHYLWSAETYRESPLAPGGSDRVRSPVSPVARRSSDPHDVREACFEAG